MNIDKRWIISYADSSANALPTQTFCNVSSASVVSFEDNRIIRLTICGGYVINEVFSKDGSSKEIEDFHAKSLSELLVKLDLEGYLFDEPSIV